MNEKYVLKIKRGKNDEPSECFPVIIIIYTSLFIKMVASKEKKYIHTYYSYVIDK